MGQIIDRTGKNLTVLSMVKFYADFAKVFHQQNILVIPRAYDTVGKHNTRVHTLTD